MATVVADQIEQEILQARHPAGTLLGSEDELIERYGVSRPVLREAIRLVEHHQLAAPRRGGGLVVRPPSLRTVAEGAAIYFDFIDTPISDVYAARSILEPLALQLLAERLDSTATERLREHIQAELRPEFTLGDQPSFHLVAAELTDSPVLITFITALVHASDKRAPPSHLRRHAFDLDHKGELHDVHERVLDGLLEGDLASSQKLLLDHLNQLSESTTARQRVWQAEDDSLHVDRDAWLLGDAGEAKLTERVARSIQQRVRRLGWPVGELLATEPELMTSLSVGRSVLRQAIRILEHHGVVEMRTGRHGGLFVAEPRPERSARAMALQLAYNNTMPEDIAPVRRALERQAIEAVTRRMHEEPSPSPLMTWAKSELERGSNSPDLHHRLASASDNGAVSYLLTVLLQTLEASGQAIEPRGKAITAQDHRAILEAVLARDAPLASRRLHSHLDGT